MKETWCTSCGREACHVAPEEWGLGYYCPLCSSCWRRKKERFEVAERRKVIRKGNLPSGLPPQPRKEEADTRAVSWEARKPCPIYTTPLAHKDGVDFTKAVDDAFRFLCGLHLTDHPKETQRELLCIVRNLRPFLKPGDK